MNLVEKRHGGGTFVTSLDPRLLAEPINFLLQVDPMAFEHLFEVRLVLEVAAARIGATRMTPDRIDRLGQLTADAQRALGQPSRYLQYDFDIHTAIVEATDNPIYLSLYHSIADLSIESRKRTARSQATRQRAHEDHVAIVAAFRARDPGAAAEAMEEHLNRMWGALDAVGAGTRARPSVSRLDGHRRQEIYRREPTSRRQEM